ncbi:MAG: TIGR02281 family clan AA aspartic protease [Proteobacteria bacterium]|nr:TIGR02281 family clan AA aspartic protease [Pseudomonadota bacterium]
MASPWERPPEDHRGPSGRTIRWRFLIILSLIGAGLLSLNFAFPDWGGRGSKFSLVYNVSWITLLAASAIAFSRTSMKIHVRNALIWLGIFMVVIVGASYWQEWRALGSRVAGSLVPGRVIEQGGAIWVQRAQDGQFWLLGEVNGTEIRFMVDTGASVVVLTMEDAARAGIFVGPADFTAFAQTANGTIAVAPVRIGTLAVGSITEVDLPAIVNGGELSVSLLGMSFLNRLSGFEVRGDRLYLNP